LDPPIFGIKEASGIPLLFLLGFKLVSFSFSLAFFCKKVYNGFQFGGGWCRERVKALCLVRVLASLYKKKN
jgi:hypothetical protein